MLVCPKCGLESSPGKKFCRACGTELPKETVGTEVLQAGTRCPTCDQPRPATAKFCRSCGTPTAQQRSGVAEHVTRSGQTVTAPSESSERGFTNGFPLPPNVPSGPAGSVKSRTVAPPGVPSDVGSFGVPEVQAAQTKRRGRAVAIGVAITAVAGLAGVGGYLWQSRIGRSGPGENVLAASIRASLPPHVTLESLQIVSSEQIEGAVRPSFRTRVRASLGVIAGTFVEGSREEDAVIIAPLIAPGGIRTADGVAVSTLSAGAWGTELSWEADPLTTLGYPREHFTANRVIVQGSSEEIAFRQEQQQQREAAERLAQERRARDLAREEELERARLEAERLKAATALAEQQRVEAAREAERARLALEEQRQREAAERQALEEAERRMLADSERRRREEETARARSIPRGAEVNVRLLTTLNSGRTQVEERFEAAVTDDFTVNGRTVIPAGSVMRGIVSSVQQATRTNRTARMTLAFDLLTVEGSSYPIRGRVTKAISGPGIKGDAAKIGAGATVGAIIGGILGGGKGALAGVLVGAGGTVAATEGKEVELAQGSVVRVRIDLIQIPHLSR